MTIRVPDTLTVDNSEKYEVSIRLWPDGLSFSGYVPAEKDSFFTETVLFDGGIPIAQSLKDIFFDNQCFSYLYRSLYVICASGKYTLVPENVFSEKDKSQLFSFCHQQGNTGKILAQPLTNLQLYLLYSIDNDVYEFLIRSLVNPRFIYSLSPLLVTWQKMSITSYPKQLNVFIHNGLLDIACFERGEMLFANSFDYEKDDDIIYYIMYACKQIGVNQLEDSIRFYGNEVECHSAMSVMKKYIGQVNYFPPGITSYRVASDRDVYVDVIALTECGL